MKVKVSIEGPAGQSVEHVADVSRKGDLLEAAGVAMETYRKKSHEIPLFDYSTIKIERAD